MHPERVSPLYPPESRKRRKTVQHEEALAWVRFYRRVGDAEIATEVLALLESDVEARRDHPALVLLCRESLRRHKAAQQRRKRLAQVVRVIVDTLIVAPAYVLRRAAAGSIDFVIECFRASPGDRAGANVRRLTANTRFAITPADVDGQRASVGAAATSPAVNRPA